MIQDSMTQSRNESHAIRETIQSSTQGFATQTDIRHINDLLERLLRSHSAQETTAAPRVIEVADEGVAQPKVEVDHEDGLEETIFFVIEALQGRRGIFADDNAQEICDALLDFLDKAFSSGLLLSLAPGWTSARDRNDDDDLWALRVNLRAAKGAILASRQISVNQGDGPSTKRHFANGTIPISQKTRLKNFELRSGTVSALSTESHSKNSGKQQAPGLLTRNGETRGDMENSVYKTDTRISFTPRLQGRTAKGRGFEAILRKSHGYQGSYQAIPRLFVNNILPENSPVFRVVRNGELAKFQNMLIQGEASLRDQDEYGTPLLFLGPILDSTVKWESSTDSCAKYATKQPDMCRFLLEHGADVDHFAPIPEYGLRSGNALSTYVDELPQKMILESPGQQQQCESICQRLLLNAGCDPNIRGINSTGEPLSAFLDEVYYSPDCNVRYPYSFENLKLLPSLTIDAFWDSAKICRILFECYPQADLYRPRHTVLLSLPGNPFYISMHRALGSRLRAFHCFCNMALTLTRRA